MSVPISKIVCGTRSELCQMTWDEYKDFPAMNGSVLVEGRKSLLHLKHAWSHGRKDTDAMRFGRLLHCLLFEPEEVAARYRTWEERRSGNEYELFCVEAAIAGAEVVKATGEYSLENALEAATGFLRNERVKSLISAGVMEQAVLCVESGLQCKGRLDWVSTSEHVLVDVKTTARIEASRFGQQFFDLGYDIKLGLYRRWLNRVTNDFWPVEVIVLENKPPYDVAVMPIPDAVLEDGAEDALLLIDSVAKAIESDEWPGVASNDIMPLVVPYYRMREETEEYQG